MMSIRQLSQTSIGDVMLKPGRFPQVGERTLLKQAIEEMGQHRLGIVCITDDDGMLAGIITDGDLRRKLLTVQKPFSSFFGDDAIEHAAVDPKVVRIDDTLNRALEVMEAKQIWDLPVVSAEGKLLGLVHLHPVVQHLLND